MPSLHPALLIVAGALLLPVLPRPVRPAWFVGVPLVAGLMIWLDPGMTLPVGFYGFELETVRVDRFSLPFASVFVVIAAVAGLYGLRTMGLGERVAALAYVGSGVGVVLAGDLVTLFFFWELKVVTSVFLIWGGRRPGSGRAGLRYLFVHLVGGVVLLAGMLWWIAETGSIAFGSFGDPSPAAVMILIGILFSAAAVPLHAWLPDAYPRAGVAGMVFLSAYTTKAGVYALIRGFPGTEALLWLGIVMALYGVVYAIIEDDIRRVLAYHIVSQVGFMVAGVGIGTEAALNGATAHAVAHILYKGLLIMGAGAVLHATGRSRMSALGGLYRALPAVFVLYMIGAFSISAMPPLSGFVSKEITLSAASAADLTAAAWLLKLAAIGTFLSVGLKLPYFTWFGPGRPALPDVGRIPVTMYLAMGVAAALNIAIGVLPGPFYELMPFTVDHVPYTGAHVTEVLQLLVLTALAAWWLRGRLTPQASISLDTDWFYRDLPARLAARIEQRPRRAPAAGRTIGRRAADLWEGGTVAVRRTVLGDDAAAQVPSTYPTWFIGAVVVGAFLVTLIASLAW